MNLKLDYKYFAFLLLIILISSCSKKQQTYFAYYDLKNIRFDEQVKDSDPQIDHMIAPYKIRLDSLMNDTIGYNDFELEKSRPGSTMTNWFADVIKDGYESMTKDQVDVLIQNYGGLRINSLGVGPITVGKLYEVMPFDNMAVVCELDGDVMTKLIQKVAQKGGWPISKKSGFTIKDSVAQDIIINGKPFDKNKTYKVLLSDYLANGGDECDFLKNVKRKDVGIKIRDIMIYYYRTFIKIHVDKEPRIKLKK